MKILFISLSGAGDVLMATPLIRELKKAFPKAKIDCLVMQGAVARDLLVGNPYVDKIIYFNFLKKGVLKSLKFCRDLRKRDYNISITTYPQARYHYSVVSFLIGAKRRIGFEYESHAVEFNKLFFSDIVIEKFSDHVVSNNLKVLELLGIRHLKSGPGPFIKLEKENIDFAKKFFSNNKIKKAAVIHPGSGLTKNFHLKRWSDKKFSELCIRLSEEKNYIPLIVGGPDENSLKERIVEQSGLKKNKEIFCPSGNIKDIAAIIKKSEVVVSNDTLMGHLAAAAGTKVVSLFGPTSWENTGPYTKNRVIITKRPAGVKPFIHGKGITTEQASYMDQTTVNDVFKQI